MSKTNLVLNKVPIVIKKKSSFTLKQKDTKIYDSNEMNYFKEKYKRVTLYNSQNILNNSSRLIAKMETLNGDIMEKTSDEIVKIIGQNKFEVLFMALCSIINQEIRIRGLISILTTNKAEKLVQNDVQTKKIDAWSQTNETRLAKVNVNRKRRIRKHLTPYVVQDFKVPEKIKKVIVDISNYTSTSNSLIDSNYKGTSNSNELKVLGDLDLHDDNSNCTSLSNISDNVDPKIRSLILQNSELAIKTIDEHTNKLFHTNNEENISINDNTMFIDNENTMKNNNLDNEEEIQDNFKLTFSDNTFIILPKTPEDRFHIATAENLKFLDWNSRQKLIELQKNIDLKYCMTPVDDDENLPIHMAVLNEDIHLLKRQCFMLNLKEISVDVEANGLTPLKLSLFKESASATSLLLTFGADPLTLDERHSTYFHTAAELNTEHLNVLLQYCNDNARSIILDNEDLQLPGWKEKSDKELSSYLMDHICSIHDSQGNTPLMVATNLGLYNNVRSLLTHSPCSVNTVNPTTGNTALYLAVVAACNVAAERNNKSKLVDHFRKTIETLLDYGADPTIDNYSGSNISVLLTDFQCPELSMLIANRGPASKYNKMGNYNSLIFIKDGDMINNNNKKTMQLKNFRKIKEKPVILESIVLNKSHSDSEIKNESDPIKLNSGEGNTDSTKSNADPTNTDSNVIKIEYDSFKNHDIPNINNGDSSKTHLNTTKSKLIHVKKPTKISESSEKSIKISSNNIIINKPDKIILTPIKRFEIDKSNNSIKIIDSSIEKVESSINLSTVIIESISNVKANHSLKSRSNTSTNFNSDTKSNKLPSVNRLLYTPNGNSITRNRFFKSNASVVISTQNKNKSLTRTISIDNKRERSTVSASIPSTKKSIEIKIESDNNCEALSKSNKRKLSDSE